MEDYAAQRAVSPDPAPEAPALEPAAPSAQEPANSGTAEPQETATDPAAQPEAPQESPQQREQQRRARGVQKRIDELTRNAAEANRRADLLLEAHRELVARTARGEPGQPQQPPTAETQRPREEDFPGDYRSFLRAEAQWEARQVAQEALQQEREARQREVQQREQETQHAQAIAQVETVLTDFGKRNAEYAKAAPDFAEASHALDHIEVGPHNVPMVQTILLRPDSAKILHHLGLNPAEAERISSLPHALQGAAIGEFAASVNRAPRPSNAPTPGRPVSGMRPPNAGVPASNSMDDYASWRTRKTRA